MYEDNDLNKPFNESSSPNGFEPNRSEDDKYIDVDKYSEVTNKEQAYTQNLSPNGYQMPPHHQAPPYRYEAPIYNHQQAQNIQPKKKGSFGKLIAGLVVVSLVGGISIGASFAFISPYANDYYNSTHKNSSSLSSGGDTQITESSGGGGSRVLPLATNNSIADIANNIGPSVVSIKNNQVVATWYGEFDQSGLGSGVIFKQDDKKIYIVSNAHVVEGADSLVVNFLGNTKVEAEIVGVDTVTDIAVIAVNKEAVPAEAMKDIKVAPLGNSENLQVGELAVAIGNPIDEAYNNTVTVGVISALNREVQLVDKKLKLIQTDAAINPGNSGGALVGPSGEVIGINTIKLVDSQIEGMGFAIPINDIKPIIEEILQNGKISRPALGIVGKDIDAQAAELYEIPLGVYVVEVAPGSSAELAGIRPNDILFQFDGNKVTGMNQLKEFLNSKKVGDVIEVKVIREDAKKTLQLKLREMPKVSYK
ncbi:MAG: serine protease Do [Clostridia bacterium]|jgi:serine protease Do|nr:serine protease Do [Clostridia bacterium]